MSIGEIIDRGALSLGKTTREAVEQLGSIVLFVWKTLVKIPQLLVRFDLVTEQMFRMGIGSLPIVILISVVTGFVVTWQVKYLAGDIIPMTYLGMAVSKASLTEMGPTFTALILSGRISAKLASELGTMKVTEQIDAMECLSLNVFYYLFAPRILAGFFMTAILFIYSSVITIVSAQFLATMAFDLHPYTFYNSMKLMFHVLDVVILLVKGFVFGGILSAVGCYYGYITTGGAVGVGQSTKNAVVASSVLVLLSDVIISQILMK